MMLLLLLSADAVGGGGACACACACACARVVSNAAVAGAAAPENVALSAGLHCTPYKATVRRKAVAQEKAHMGAAVSFYD